MAERVGFEPTDPQSESTDFESAPFDHSGTSPQAGRFGALIVTQKAVSTKRGMYVCREQINCPEL